MAKCRKVKSRLAAVVLVFMAGAALLFVFTVKYDQGKEEDWGIPDAVSTVSDGETCRLTVVANCREIEDREMFAENVIRMYTENAFRSIRVHQAAQKSTSTGLSASRTSCAKLSFVTVVIIFSSFMNMPFYGIVVQGVINIQA